MLKNSIITILLLIFTCLTLLGIWFAKCETFLNTTYITYDLKVEKNEPFNVTYDKLFKYLKTPIFFKYFLTKVKKVDTKIKYGTYKFENTKLSDVITHLTKGETFKIKVTVLDGYNIYDVAKLLDSKNIVTYEIFLSKCFDKKFLLETVGQDVPSCEGFLYPDTYFFEEEAEPQIVINAMYKNFLQNLPEDFQLKANRQGLSFYEALILASIIQKETSNIDEMPVISSIFHNRLKKGMRLEADPTIIYGIYENFDGNIKKSHLRDSENPYNTYKIKGLPPTPICNPDKNALFASVNPANTDYLYFVSDNNGNHLFSKTYSEHINKVDRFQRQKR